MEPKFEKAAAGEKLAGFFTSYRKVLLAGLAVLACFVVVFGVLSSVISKANARGLEDIDSIAYIMTKDSASLSEADLEKRRENALAALVKYNTKGGVVGVRANMLSAEVKFSQKKFDEAAKFWTTAAAKGKGSYTAPLAYFNAGTAYENASDLENAEKSYEKAVSYKDFDQIAHAKFSLGRVKEAKGDKAGAVEVYSELFGSVPQDSWAQLAQSRLLTLELEDKE